MKSSHIFLSCAPFSLLLLLVIPSLGLDADGTLLLSFKYSILNDPLSVLDSWDYNDENACLWTGVKCGGVESKNATLRVVGLSLPNSQLVGSLPEDLGFISFLKMLDLSGNFLNGTLPNSLFNGTTQIEVVSLSNNVFYGWIPDFFPGPKSLRVINLSENALVGNIPAMLASLENLTVVSLRGNSLSGPVPAGIQAVESMDLSANLLNGSLPSGFGGVNLKYLNLSYNKITGDIPAGFAEKITATAVIDLSYNALSGQIPESASLSNQKTEAFAGNADLCGKPLNKLCTVPSTLSIPPNVSTANTSSSSPAIAAIPKTIVSTPLPDSSATTTATAAHVPPRYGMKPAAIAGIVVVPLAAIGLLATLFLYVQQKKKKRNSEKGSISPSNLYQLPKSPTFETRNYRNLSAWPCLSITKKEETTSESTSSDCDNNNNNNNNIYNSDHIQIPPPPITHGKNPTTLTMVDGETDLELETLLKASAYILGSSSSSIVYKAVLQDGSSFAVRRIGDSGIHVMKEFEYQVKSIARLRHPNLVRVRGFYWGDFEKLVIYDYISNGNLANIGYRKIGSSPYLLPFQARLNIAKGIARGLTFIHRKKNVHGNIKPTNILLTHNMEPIITDLGLNHLLHGKHIHKSSHFGSKRSNLARDDTSPTPARPEFIGCTFPYHAPESLKNMKPSPKWDVYSFGILLIELLTGKAFTGEELGQWNGDTAVEDRSRVLRMADAAVRAEVVGREEAILAWFKLGVRCASLVPQKRPCMKDALQVLERM